MRLCRCIMQNKKEYHPYWVYPFEAKADGSYVVDDPPCVEWSFESYEEFNKFFVEIDDDGRALVAVNGDPGDMAWETENSGWVYLRDMTNIHIYNCMVWLADADHSEVKDGYTIKEWLMALSSQLKKNQEVK